MLTDVPTSSRFKITLKRLFIVSVVCLTLFITASSMAQATSASITFSPSSSSSTMELRVSNKGFDIRETITISVAFPGDLSNRRYHDWLRPATYRGEA